MGHPEDSPCPTPRPLGLWAHKRRMLRVGANHAVPWVEETEGARVAASKAGHQSTLVYGEQGKRGPLGLGYIWRGGGGSGTQTSVHQKWPDQIFPMVKFVISRDGHFGGGGGSRRGEGGNPSDGAQPL